MSEVIKKLEFQINHIFNEMVIRTKSRWANDDLIYFSLYLKEHGAEEKDILEKR